MRAPKGGERLLITGVESEYPLTLLEHEIGGIVRLQITISARGNVEQISLLGGNPILARSATSAVHKRKYAAARSSTTMEISIPFDPYQ